MSLLNNFNRQIYRSDLLVLFIIELEKPIKFTGTIYGKKKLYQIRNADKNFNHEKYHTVSF